MTVNRMRQGRFVLFILATLLAACVPIEKEASSGEAGITTLRTAITVSAPDSRERFRRLIHALTDQHPNASAEFSYVSNEVALEMLGKGELDLVIPFASAQHGNRLPVRLCSSTIMKGYIILYTNREQPVGAEALQGKRIETSASLAASLPFPVVVSSGPKESFKRLNQRKIDGYISAEGVADAALRQLGFTSIHRQLYRVVNGHAAIGDGPRAEAVDEFLTIAVERAERNRNPSYLMMQERTYGDWQTYLPLPNDKPAQN